MHHFIPHHLEIQSEHVVGNASAGRLFFLPGSDGRAQRIAERFEDRQVIPSSRQLNVYLGKLSINGDTVEVGTVATGMGCPSVDIVLTELIKLGARRFLRVGTAGSMQPETIRVGSIVVATAAVRDEGTSDSYICREYPAVADPDVVAALANAARCCGLADRTFRGVVHSKDSLFGREFGYGPRRTANHEYMQELKDAGVLASEMECAHLFVLSHSHSRAAVPLSEARKGEGTIKSGAILAIIGDGEPFAESEHVVQAENNAIEVALHSAAEIVA